ARGPRPGREAEGRQGGNDMTATQQPPAAPPETVPAWEQRPGEPDRAYLAFLRYLYVEGRRSVRRAHAEYLREGGRGVHGPGNWPRLSRRWGWVARALAWDTWLAKRRGRQAERRRLQPSPPPPPRPRPRKRAETALDRVMAMGRALLEE